MEWAFSPVKKVRARGNAALLESEATVKKKKKTGKRKRKKKTPNYNEENPRYSFFHFLESAEDGNLCKLAAEMMTA